MDSGFYVNIGSLADNKFYIAYFNGFKEGMPTYHLHDTFEITLVVQGNCRILFDGKLEETTGACLVVFPPNTLHRMLNEKDKIYERYNVHFDKSIIDKNLSLFLNFYEIINEPFVIPLSSRETDKILYYINQITEYTKCGVNDEYIKKSQILYLGLILNETINFFKIRQPMAINKNPHNYINDVLLNIEENIKSNFKVNAVGIAQRFNISRSKLDMDFKRETGINLNEYLILMRIKNAQKLLCGGYSILESSMMSGFNDMSHFMRSFKKHVGITPAQYAKKYSL